MTFGGDMAQTVEIISQRLLIEKRIQVGIIENCTELCGI